MSPRIPDTHAEAWNLLPWLANGRIHDDADLPADRPGREVISQCGERAAAHLLGGGGEQRRQRAHGPRTGSASGHRPPGSPRP